MAKTPLQTDNGRTLSTKQQVTNGEGAKITGVYVDGSKEDQLIKPVLPTRAMSTFSAVFSSFWTFIFQNVHTMVATAKSCIFSSSTVTPPVLEIWSVLSLWLKRLIKVFRCVLKVFFKALVKSASVWEALSTTKCWCSPSVGTHGPRTLLKACPQSPVHT